MYVNAPKYIAAALLAVLFALAVHTILHAATQGPPDRPERLRAYHADKGVGLHWIAVPGVRGYAVHRRDTSSEWRWIGFTAAPDTRWNDPAPPTEDLRPEYRIRALGEQDASDWSDTATVSAIIDEDEPVLYGWSRLGGDPKRAPQLSPDTVLAGEEVRLIGDDFGREKGIVTFAGIPLEVLDWRQCAIIVRLPAVVTREGMDGPLCIQRPGGKYYLSLAFRIMPAKEPVKETNHE